jgi:hypothetical protein
MDAAARRMGFLTWKILSATVYSSMLPSKIGTVNEVPTEEEVLNNLGNLVAGMSMELNKLRIHLLGQKSAVLSKPASDLQVILKSYPRIKPGRKPNKKRGK